MKAPCAPRRSLPGLLAGAVALVLLGLSGCAQQPVLGPEIEPEIVKIEPYEHPYEGLKIEIDPKGYDHFAYAILPEKGGDASFGVVRDKEWVPLQRNLVLDFVPKAYREWVLSIGFKHPSGKVSKVLTRKFEVGLPPWHYAKREKPIEFAVEVVESCVYSRKTKRMQQVRTVVGYEMKVVDLPSDLDRSIFTGFGSTAPQIKYTWEGTEHVLSGYGGGMHPKLDETMYFAANYDLGLDPYPECKQLPDLRAADWSAVKIWLLDQYQFPVSYTAGRVVKSTRVEQMVQR